MTASLKTQCPSCETYYSLSHAQLNDNNAKARCNRCQHVFLVGKHLASENVNIPTINNKALSNSPQKNTQNVNPSASEDNFLIYDDMPFDESDAWVAKLETTKENAQPFSPIVENYEKQKRATRKIDSNHVINKEQIQTKITPSKLEKKQYANNDNEIPEPFIRSVIANDKYADVSATSRQSNNNSDNAWLEKMLKDQDETINDKPSDNNLTTLLTSMGVPVIDNSAAKSYPVKESQHRQPTSQSRAQTSAASILWAIGCLVLIMLLFAQYVIFNLDDLIKNPNYATRLQSVCSLASCSLPNADINAFDIDQVKHRPSQIKTSGKFSDIEAALVNETSQPQLLPSLKVSIYENKALIGEFVAQPKDYLLSPERLLFAQQSKPFMFTVPISDTQINQITIQPIY